MAYSNKNAEQAVLSDYIPAEKFRTILPEYRRMEGGYSEIPVEIHMKPPFAKTLSFKVGWDEIVYGFVRDKKSILAKLGGMSEVKLITISDWDDCFMMIFEGSEDKDEKRLSVTPDEVRELLENCRRVPEQMSIR
jgi:hypothetical protein